jgi:imidazolonepropionase-like amidohydrolase
MLALVGPALARPADAPRQEGGTVAIVNARLATIADAEPVDGGTLVIADGRIAAAGRAVPVPAGARVIDAAGRWVTPGLFAGFSRLGLIEVDSVADAVDSGAPASPFSAAIDVAPGINPSAPSIAITRIEGVTRAVVAPTAARAIFGGQGAIIGLGTGADPVMPGHAFQFVELGERGAELAGGSRGAALAEFRNAMREAGAVARDAGGREGGWTRDSILPELDAEALVPVVTGRMPILIHVERASDVRTVLRLKREFPRLRPVLVGASEGWLVAPEIAAAGVPVVTSALNNLPSRFETLAATQSNVGRLVDAGVTVALGLIDDDEGRQVRLLPQHAGNLVALTRVPGASGLTHAQALAALTQAPAAIFGLAGELGTLERGKRADVVVWDGDPLELSSAPVALFIDGAEIPLTSRQTELRDRYLPLVRQAPATGGAPAATR